MPRRTDQDKSSDALPTERNSPEVSFVYVVGPSSSGKTTLCNALAAEMDLGGYVKEVARTVMQQQGFSRDDVGEGGKIEMQKAIMVAQIKAEEDAHLRATEQGKGGWRRVFRKAKTRAVILSDRSAIDPIVYADWCVESPQRKWEVRREMEDVSGFSQVLGRYKASLFVLLGPVGEWIVDDGVRTMGAHQRFHDELVERLEEYGIPFKTMGENVKDLGERVGMVRKWVGSGETAA